MSNSPLINPSDDLKILAALPWRLDSGNNVLLLDGEHFERNQELLQKYSYFMKLSQSSVSLYAPKTNNLSDLVHHKVYDACHAPAKKRIQADIERASAFNWEAKTPYIPNRFSITSDSLTDEDLDFLDSLVHYGTFGLIRAGARQKKQTYIIEDFIKGASLKKALEEKRDKAVKDEAGILANYLDWTLTSDGNLVASIVESPRAKEKIGYIKKIISERGVAFTDNDLLSLSPADSNNWENLTAFRIALYNEVEKSVVEKAKSLFSELKEKDWKYGLSPDNSNPIRAKYFYIKKSKLSYEQISSLLAFDGGFAAFQTKYVPAFGGGTFPVEGDYIVIADHEIVGDKTKLSESLALVKAQFIDALSSKITLPQIPQEILDLPWSYSEDSVLLPSEDRLNLVNLAQGNGINIISEGTDNWNEYIKIPISSLGRFYVSNIAFVEAVKQNTEKKQAAFIAENADNIAALPWRVYPDTDLTSQSWAIHLKKYDLNTEEKKLLENLENLGLIRPVNYYKEGVVLETTYRNHSCGKLNHILKPILEAKQNQLAEEYVKLDWKWDGTEHSDFILKGEIKGESYNLFIKKDGETTIENLHCPEANVHPKVFHGMMLRKLAEKFAKNMPQTLDADLAKLNWHYDGGDKSSITLDASNLDDETLAELRRAIPSTQHIDEEYENENSPRIKFVIYGNLEKGSFDTLGIVHKGLYESVAPTAERNYAKTINESANFPWQKGDDGRYFVIKNKLNTAQQKTLERINPEEHFDMNVLRSGVRRNVTKNYTLKDCEANKDLITAIEKNHGLQRI